MAPPRAPMGTRNAQTAGGRAGTPPSAAPPACPGPAAAPRLQCPSLLLAPLPLPHHLPLPLPLPRAVLRHHSGLGCSAQHLVLLRLFLKALLGALGLQAGCQRPQAHVGAEVQTWEQNPAQLFQLQQLPVHPRLRDEQKHAEQRCLLQWRAWLVGWLSWVLLNH